MADINFCIQPEATESENIIQGWVYTGALSNINDNNESTYREVYQYTYDGNLAWVEFEHEIDFGVSVSIKSVAIVSEVLLPIPVGAGITNYYIYLYYNAQWNLVYTGPTGIWSKTTHTQNGTWSNVTKIKAYWKGYSGPFFMGSEIHVKDFELRAWGTTYIDIGLRIRTSSGTIKIGVKDLEATHKLRIRKGNTTYGIPLLATNDSDASGLRIYDGSSVKALPKVD